MILDTEVYSNTGGQMSKSTSLAATAKFAEMGKRMHKKDLGQQAMTYGNVYVGSISLFADNQQAIKTLLEAEAYPGPSVVLCYSPCIEHGYEMSQAIQVHFSSLISIVPFFAHFFFVGTLQQAKLAVDTGYWSLY